MAEIARVPAFTAKDLEDRPFSDQDLAARAPALVVLLRGLA